MVKSKKAYNQAVHNKKNYKKKYSKRLFLLEVIYLNKLIIVII